MPRLEQPALLVVLVALAVLIVATTVVPVTASPAPVSACPPCAEGFVYASESNGLETEVRHSEATVRVHENGSAAWTARVVPTNESVLDRLAEDRSLARSVASESFGTRYGAGIEHELVSADVANGEFVIRYRTLDVGSDSVFGTHTFTYFRDSPGAYIYTDLGADELTIVGPPGTTVARGFGKVDGRRMTATELPDARDGPFVVFAPEDSAAPGLLGALAVLDALGGVVVRNVLLFVAVPSGILVGGLGGIRRLVDPNVSRNPARIGITVAIGGALLLAGTLAAEGDALPAVTGNLLVGGFVGAILLGLGAAVAVPGARRYLSAGRLVGSGIGAAAVVVAVSDGALGMNTFHTALGLGVVVLPAAVALGRADVRGAHGDGALAQRLYVGLSVAVVAVLATVAPLTALGGTLFFLFPLLLTVAAVGVVVAAIPLYLLGVASVTAEST